MSLQQWADNGWLKVHKTSPQEIANLLAIVRRDLKDAGTKQISSDWRFGMAYNAALKLCTIILFAEGYQPEKNLAHYRTLQSLPIIMGPEFEDDAVYLDACRSKRNALEYESVGGVTNEDSYELIDFTIELETKVMAWLKLRHSALLPETKSKR